MKTIVCIFAHPDDESFGPGGTIALLAKEHKVYLICVTNGDAGQNCIDDTRELGELRREELRESAKILGVKQVMFLEYKDGCLSNSIYHEIADRIKEKLDVIQPDTLLTFEQRGISGHIDHITVSMVCSYLYEKLSYLKKIMYYVISEDHRALEGEYFIYFPPGYNKDDIDETYDISPVWEQKIESMMAHKTQQDEGKALIKLLEQLPKEEYFLVKKKN